MCRDMSTIHRSDSMYGASGNIVNIFHLIDTNVPYQYVVTNVVDILC